MNVLIAYATNSGGTMAASEIVQKSLEEKGIEVKRQDIRDVNAEKINGYDLVVFGSPSWNYAKIEGMPHEFFTAFIQKTHHNIVFKKTAIFGLGDSAYINFCGAVDHLEKFVQDHGGELIAKSLRIDGFFFAQHENEKLLRAWSESLVGQFERGHKSQI